MKTQFVLSAVLLVNAIPLAAQKVYIDYDRATPFSQYKTFQFRETQEDLRDTSPTLHQTLVTELRRYIREGGMQEVESNPDIYIAYYTADWGNLRRVMTDTRYTYGPDWTWGPHWSGTVGTRTPTSFTFNEGTLVIDAWDVEEERLIWRGIATAALSKNPEKNAKKIDKAIEKLAKKWEKEYEKAQEKR